MKNKIKSMPVNLGGVLYKKNEKPWLAAVDFTPAFSEAYFIF